MPKLNFDRFFRRPRTSDSRYNAVDTSNEEFVSRFKNEFEDVEIIGVGAYGSVFKAKSKLDKMVYALKRIHTQTYKVDAALKEVEYLAKIKHDGIVRYFTAFAETPPAGWQMREDEELMRKQKEEGKETLQLEGSQERVFVYIQTELCKQSLRQWLVANHSRDWKQVKKWFGQLLQAVAHLHRESKIHRDLKPANILIDFNDDIKICDLGSVCPIIENGQDKTRTANVGTPKYMAPEQISSNDYSREVDKFSLGLILAEMSVPMTTDQAKQVFDSYRQGIAVTILDDHCEAKELVAMLVNKDPSKRLDCDQILCHPFMYSFTDTDAENVHLPRESARPYDSSYRDEEESSGSRNSDYSDSREEDAAENNHNAASSAREPRAKTDEERVRDILDEPVAHYAYGYNNSEQEAYTLYSIPKMLFNLSKSDDFAADLGAVGRHHIAMLEKFLPKLPNLQQIRKTS